MIENNPSETARHVLRLLVSRGLAPMPDNSVSIFYEITGDKPDAGPQNAEWMTLVYELHEQLAHAVECCLPVLDEDNTDIGPTAWTLIRACRSEFESLDSLNSKLSTFNHRLSLTAENQGEIHRVLLNLLQLVFEDIAKLSSDSRWLRGQAEALMKTNETPVSLRRLDDLRCHLMEVIQEQSLLESKSIETQEEMKRLLAAFMEYLSVVAEASGEHRCQMEICTKKIESANNIAEIAPATRGASSATCQISLESICNRGMLSAVRVRAEEATTEVAQPRKAFNMALASARHDLLTGALNHKGLEETLEREVARVAYQNTTLCITFLDIDNFKSVNDTYGYSFGDDVLSHLVQAVRESIRPQDTPTRFSGEEFVTLMPDTSLEEGVQAIVRLQRVLIQRSFVTGDMRLSITSSAGVAGVGEGEPPVAAIQYADCAMYQAKRVGKNKVVSA